MTAFKTSFLNAVGLFSLFLNKENGMIHKTFSPINPIVHCTEIPYLLLLLLWFPTHQNVLSLCIGGVDKKETYKPQHDSVNYSFNVDTRNLCNVSQQASNQATWKTNPTLRSPIFNKQDTLSTHSYVLQKEQKQDEDNADKGIINTLYGIFFWDNFFSPGDQYRKTVASAAHRTEI